MEIQKPQLSPSSTCNVQVVLKCLSHTPGSHSVCAVRSLVHIVSPLTVYTIRKVDFHHGFMRLKSQMQGTVSLQCYIAYVPYYHQAPFMATYCI